MLDFHYPDTRKNFWIGCELLRVCEEAIVQLTYQISQRVTKVAINDVELQSCKLYLDSPSEIPHPYIPSGEYHWRTAVPLVIDVESVNEKIEEIRDYMNPSDNYRIKVETT